jgi:acetylglutamate kinase
VGHRVKTPLPARLVPQASVTGIWVVKIGGRLCEDRDSQQRLARTLAGFDSPTVLVHGGGDAVTRLQASLGHEPRFIEGRRVTAVEDLDAIEMVLTGTINQALVRALAAAGRPALGLSGCSAGLVRCDLVDGLGRVGSPRAVDPRVLHLALGAGYVPVVSPVSLGPDGDPVNVNADEMAAALAASLGAERLLLLSDVEGVRVEESWQAEIPSAEVESLVASGEVTRGMIPKLRAAARAVALGVGEVRIAGFDGGRLEAVRGTRVMSTTTERRGIARG